MKILVTKDNQEIFRLEVLNDDLTLGNDLYIGREQDCHIVLSSPQVSRHHAIISFVDNKLQINSIDSSNLLKINGSSSSSGVLYENSIVEILNFSINLSEIPVYKEPEAIDSVEEKEPGDLGENLLEDTTVFQDDEEQKLETDESENDNNDEQEESEEGLNQDDEVLADNDIENIEDDNDLQTELMDFEESDKTGFDILGDSEFTPEDDNENDDDFDIEAEFGTDETSNDGDEFSSENDEFGGDNDFDNNNEFGDDSFSGNNDGFGNDSEATQLVQTFAKFSLKLFGEYAPFDRFMINDHEVFIGRDAEKCQIVLEDPEVSKVHAVIKRTMLNYTLMDLDSANGIILNGERVNKSELSNGDEFLIGDTTFTVTISSDIIEAEKDILMPIEDNQEVEIEEIIEEEVGFDDFHEEEEVEEKSFIKKILKDPKKKRIAIFLIVIMVILFIVPDEQSSLEDDGSKSDAKKVIKKESKVKKKFSEETLEGLEANYSLAVANFKKGDLSEAKEYLDIVMSADPNYKNSQTMAKLIQEGLDKEVRLKEREQTEAERRERQLKIATLIEKAKKAVEKREVEVAKSYFNQIFELDPENIDVPPLRLELEAYVEDKRRREQDIALKKASRQNKVNQLSPAKTLYLKGDWFKAVDALEKFLQITEMDEDLTTEATDMLKDSRKKLLQIINPLVSKARSYKEGQDLKQAYEIYGDVLKYNPTNEEALDERDNIFTALKNRSRKIYREALVAESLSLYSKAKEKFQEVQQVSPINSEYYNKASDKLKNYLE